MTCTNETRPPTARERHYPSDTTDAEWAVLEPLLPIPACELPTGGRPEKHPRRNVVDAIRYVDDNGCKWRAVPVDFGIPWRTVYGFFQRWRASGELARIHAELHQLVRVHDGLNPRTVAVILDSQSVKGAETVGQDTRGFDGGRLINGRKRHLAVDMRGMALAVMVTPAAPHDSIPARDQLFRRQGSDSTTTRSGTGPPGTGTSPSQRKIMAAARPLAHLLGDRHRGAQEK